MDISQNGPEVVFDYSSDDVRILSIGRVQYQARPSLQNQYPGLAQHPIFTALDHAQSRLNPVSGIDDVVSRFRLRNPEHIVSIARATALLSRTAMNALRVPRRNPRRNHAQTLFEQSKPFWEGHQDIYNQLGL